MAPAPYDGEPANAPGAGSRRSREPRSVWAGRAYRLSLVVSTVLLSLGSAASLACLAGLPTRLLALPGAAFAFVLSRRTSGRPAGEELLPSAVFAAVAGTAAALAWLMPRHPVVGAAAFVALVTASGWVRRFGRRAGRAGAVVPLALIASLMAPVGVRGWWPVGGWLALAALPAFWWGPTVRWVGHRLTGLPGWAGRRAGPLPPRRPGTMSAGTRKALQTSVLLTAAFTAGMLLYARHWPWTVLSAMVVGSATGGRANLVLRAAERGVGAVAGTLLATGLAAVCHPEGAQGIVLILVVLTTAAGLREVSLPLFVAALTAMMSLLNGYLGRFDVRLLPVRLQALALGYLLAVTVGWLLAPVRAGDVLRFRLTVALDELAAVLDARRTGSGADAALVRFEDAAAAVEEVAAPHRLHRLLRSGSRTGVPHRADLVDALRDCCRPLRTLAAGPVVGPAEARTEATVATLRSCLADHRAPVGLGRAVATGLPLTELDAAVERLARALPALAARTPPAERPVASEQSPDRINVPR
ncbi:FUSC family protein [Kitasatospora acidiphila]|uniref:FUSC family protein n=1 Tax=Kitasatospora acidiphila TaxID=2567942 RepID=UPI003C73305A